MNYPYQEKVPSIWQIGDVILDKYEIRAIFTSGGMGLVYRVYHKDWNMDIAVKSPRPECFQTDEQVSNFEREAETWGDLGLHPNIVSCFYVRRLGGIPRIFSEFVDGGTLADWIRSGRLYQGSHEVRMKRILDIAIQVAWGLNYSHQKGLVHQDVKPGNVLMTSDGTARVSDFGLASARSAAHKGTATTRMSGQSILVEGAGYLTPEYASPEQFAGLPLSTASDVWSWAVLVLEMLKGECDWADGRAAPYVLEEFYQEKVNTDPLAQVLYRCLMVNIKQRPSKMLDQAGEIVRIYEELTGESYPRSYAGESRASSEILNNKGASLLDLGKTERGIEFLEEAIKLKPNNASATFNLLVTAWRSAKANDEGIIYKLASLRDESNSELIDELLDRICSESGVPNEARTARIKGLPANETRLKVIARHPSPLAAIRLIITDKGETQLITVSRTGSAFIQKPDGSKVDSFSIPQPADLFPTTPEGRWVYDGIWISNCIITDHGKCIIFTQHKPLAEPYKAKMKDGKNEIPIETRIYSFSLATKSIVQSQIAHTCSLSCFRLINENELLTSGINDGFIRIWKLLDLRLVAELDLSSPEKANRMAGAWPFRVHNKRILVAAYEAIELPSSGNIILCQQDEPRIWKRPKPEENFRKSRKSFWGGVKQFFGTSSPVEDWELIGKIPKLSRDLFVHRLTLSPNGDYIAGGRPLHVWDLNNGTYKVYESNAGNTPEKLVFSPTNKYLLDTVLHSDFILIRLWQVSNGRWLSTIKIKEIDNHIWDVKWYDDHVVFFGCNSRNQVFSINIFFPFASSFLSLARPSSYSDIGNEREFMEANIALAENAFECGNYTTALNVVRSIQMNNAFPAYSRIADLERKICNQGKFQKLKFGILECQLDKIFNEKEYSTKTQRNLKNDLVSNHRKSTVGNISSTTPDGRWTILSQRITPSYDNVVTVDDAFEVSVSELVIWDNSIDRAVSSMKLPGSSDTLACISDDGKWAVVLIRRCMRQKATLARYSCSDWKIINTYFEDEDRRISQIALCDGNSKLLSLHKGVELWDIVTGKLLKQFPTSRRFDFRAPMDSFGCFPFAFLGSYDGFVSVIDCDAGTEIFAVPVYENVYSLLLSHDKIQLIVNDKWVIHLFWDFEFPSEIDAQVK